LETFVQKLRIAAVIGAALLAAAGLAGASAGELVKTHVLTVRLPDGSLEQIRYAGDEPPRISFGDQPAPLLSQGFESFGADSPFAMLERMSAEMDREAAALWNETARLSDSGLLPSGALTAVDFGNPPPGARSFSVVSTLSGGHVCMRSVEYSASPDGGRPRIVTRTSGDCGPDHHRPLSSGVRRGVEPVHSRPGLIEVNDRPDDAPALDGAVDRVQVGLR
jgi:hypothetical protein